MSKFKVGDKVKVKVIKNGNQVEIFKQCEYKITTIIGICERGYRLDIDKGTYIWYDHELEKVDMTTDTYTIYNLLNDFPTETLFLYDGQLFRIYSEELQIFDEYTQTWRKTIRSLKQILNTKFTKVEERKLKPMTFEEAVKTSKKIKYSYNGFIQDEFYTIQSIFKRLGSSMYGNETVSNIILNGTWYAEGVYK